MASSMAVASAGSAFAFPRVQTGAHRRPRAIPRARPGAPRLLRTMRPRAPNNVDAPAALGDDSYHNIPPERVETAAEEAMKYAVDKWLELDRVQQAQAQQIREMQERELEEVRRAAREAVEKVSSTSNQMREAEASAKLWESRAREVRADLEFTQQQLQEVQAEMERQARGGGGGGYGYGSEPDVRQLELERQAAVQKAEEAFHRLRQGEERANAQLAAANDELEVIKRMATEAARDGGARISHLEEGVSVLQSRVHEKETELKRVRENLNQEIEGLRCDVEDARNAIIQRDQHLRSAMQERDNSYLELQQRDEQQPETHAARPAAAGEPMRGAHHAEEPSIAGSCRQSI